MFSASHLAGKKSCRMCFSKVVLAKWPLPTKKKYVLRSCSVTNADIGFFCHETAQAKSSQCKQNMHPRQHETVCLPQGPKTNCQSALLHKWAKTLAAKPQILIIRAVKQLASTAGSKMKSH